MSISNEARVALERRIVRAMIRHLKAAGWSVVSVYNGDDTAYPRTEARVMEEVFSVDEVSLRFIATGALEAHDGERGIGGLVPVERRYENDWGPDNMPVHGVLLILGNGCDVVSDWNYTEGDPDGFAKAMDAFDAYAIAEAE